MLPNIRQAKNALETDRSMRDLSSFLFWKMRGAGDTPAEAAAQAKAAGASDFVVEELHSDETDRGVEWRRWVAEQVGQGRAPSVRSRSSGSRGSRSP